MSSTMETMDFALRVCESIAFALHSMIGITEPCHGIGTWITADSLPYPNLFFPVAGLCLALVALGNSSGKDAVVLGAQAYVVALHSEAVFTHWRVKHHPVAGGAPGFFVLIAFIIVAMRTNVLIALLGTVCFAGVGTLLGFLLVRSKGETPLLEAVTPIYHGADEEEPPAQIGSREAAEIQEQMWAASVERLARKDMLKTLAEVDDDAVVPDGQDLILLTFGRQGEQLTQALLESALAKRCRNNGIDVRPGWTKGGLVLAEGVRPCDLDEACIAWNAVVRAADEEEVFDALSTLPYNSRPRLKPGCGRLALPSQTSWFGVISSVSSDNASTPVDGYHATVQDISEGAAPFWEVLGIARTFLHMAPSPMASVSSRPKTV